MIAENTFLVFVGLGFGSQSLLLSRRDGGSFSGDWLLLPGELPGDGTVSFPAS